MTPHDALFKAAFSQASLAADGRSAFWLIMRYIYEVKGPDAFAGIDISAIEIDSGGREIMESMAQYLHRTGRDEGRQEGRQEGRKELFLAMVKHRFGALSPTLHAQVEAADDARLGRWSLRLLTAQTLAELFAEP